MRRTLTLLYQLLHHTVRLMDPPQLQSNTSSLHDSVLHHILPYYRDEALVLAEISQSPALTNTKPLTDRQ
jgi:hypothetical protein